MKGGLETKGFGERTAGVGRKRRADGVNAVRPLITRPRWRWCAKSMPATSRAVAQRLSAAPMIKASNRISENHGAQTTHNEAAPPINGPPTSATRVPMRSNNTPAITVPKNFPMAKAVMICAAPPAETPNWRASTGMVGIIIAHAPEKKVPPYKAVRPRKVGFDRKELSIEREAD